MFSPTRMIKRGRMSPSDTCMSQLLIDGAMSDAPGPKLAVHCFDRALMRKDGNDMAGQSDVVTGASSIFGPPIRLDEVRPVEASRIRFDWPWRVAWTLGKMIISPSFVHLDALIGLRCELAEFDSPRQLALSATRVNQIAANV
jgi:hypothetical protein